MFWLILLTPLAYCGCNFPATRRVICHRYGKRIIAAEPKTTRLPLGEGDTSMETRRVTRSRNERIIGGVAGGLAAYLNIDPLVVRLIFAVLSLANGLGIVLYLIMWLLVPQEDTQAPDTRSQVQENINDIQDTSMRFFNQVREMFRQ
jgi:phage shock protein C